MQENKEYKPKVKPIQVNEKNKIKQSALCCIYCGKTYKTRLNLENHLILCEISNKSKRSLSNVNDDTDNLIHENISSKKLYQIVMQLSMKCNRLENKVADLSKYVTKKIQKIDVIDYLNNTKSTNNPILIFENIIEIVTVEQLDIEFLFYNSFMETINQILSRNIYKNRENNELPITAFTQKQNIIYVYTKNDSNIEQNLSWTIVSREKFIRFLNLIQFKMSKALSEWRKNNAQLLNESDGQCMLYDKTFSKLMEPDFKIEKIYVKFYNNIYNKLKINIPENYI